MTVCIGEYLVRKPQGKSYVLRGILQVNMQVCQSFVFLDRILITLIMIIIIIIIILYYTYIALSSTLKAL